MLTRRIPACLIGLFSASLFSAPLAWGQGNGKPYLVRHPFTVDLNEKEVIRGAWAYQLDSKAVSRSGGTVHRTEKNKLGPFEADTAEAKTLTATSGGASATSNASMSFSQTGGFHQVDGVAAVGGDGTYARAYSSSSLYLNTGVKRANGKIRWSPTWKVDRVHGTSRAGRDPVDLTFRDRVTGEERSGRLFDLQFAFGEGGYGTWDAGKITMHGIDGLFALEMESPYLTSPQGRVLMEFDKQGLVTRSEATGIFAGHIPLLGESAALTLDVAGLAGNSDGVLDLGYDFGMEGDLGLDVSFTGDGMAQATGGISEPTTVHDFSHVTHRDITRVLQGTPFTSNQTERASEVILSTLDDAYAGFAELSRRGPQPIATLAFDSVPLLRDVRGLDARFDLQIADAPGARRPDDGVALLLLPTELAGTSGEFSTESFSDTFSSIAPHVAGGLSIGIDSLDVATKSMALITLAWNEATVGQVQVPWALTGESPDDWHSVQLKAEPLDHGTHVTVSLHNRENGNDIPVLQQVIPGLEFAHGVRPVFATTGQANQGHRRLDNVFITYLGQTISPLLGDFNSNQALDVQDLDALFAAIRTRPTDITPYDVDRDGALSSADVATWVHDLKRTWFGDANLDQAFDSTDMIAVFQAGRFETDLDATWNEGDWNGDLRFDTGDLILAFQDGGYERAFPTTQAVAAIPEPNSLALALLSLLATTAGLRRNRGPSCRCAFI